MAGLYATGTHGNGVLSVVAGHDVTLQAAQIRNAGTDGVTQLVAGNTLNVGTQTLSHSTNTTANDRNFQRSSDITHLGTTVQGAGSVVLAAGNDLNLTAAQVGAGKSLALQAGRDINSVAAVDSSANDHSTVTKSNSLAASSDDETRRPPSLSSTLVWSPIPYPEEIGREEAFFRRADHWLPARSRGRHADQRLVPAAWLQ
ncbi:hemagglutinin repeat-containing protein [Xanthomonas oryzae]|uniref:hemagglutinin repeat-containing protein n=1 Tax=Xanthomonas oryzae TaxID=347 RepID=UPI00103388FC|nr:hemagglutinin repeat-containing protein [Xanthomonas oryzae]QBH01623.1 hypothetical protein EYC56_23310 [Xanthomonas oryzae]